MSHIKKSLTFKNNQARKFNRKDCCLLNEFFLKKKVFKNSSLILGIGHTPSCKLNQLPVVYVLHQ